MTPERIAWLLKVYKPEEAIKQAINETKDEDASICALGASVPDPDASELQKQFVAMARDTSTFLSEQILASKLKEPV